MKFRKSLLSLGIATLFGVVSVAGISGVSHAVSKKTCSDGQLSSLRNSKDRVLVAQNKDLPEALQKLLKLQDQSQSGQSGDASQQPDRQGDQYRRTTPGQKHQGAQELQNLFPGEKQKRDGGTFNKK